MRLTATAQYKPRGDLGRYVETHVTPAVRASVEASCAMVERLAKHYVPVDTGELQASIDTVIEETGKTIVGRVSPHTDYAGFVEYGTRFMPAQSYMRVALDESRQPVMGIFRGEISQGLR